ncbi:hypothetical protein EV421DRAFT_1743730 [Armillaria borealis]|uniref:Uncharacterized protein n=1 Tax=Armillaria borealis TaxID=47425 RepID=A0AA39IXN1_9AGAR|nr:hypothetical protein EV421DRAFT_1743730 [Armillaria borealis]
MYIGGRHCVGMKTTDGWYSWTEDARKEDGEGSVNDEGFARLGSTRQRAEDGLRGRQEHFAGVERDGRVIGVLDSPTAAPLKLSKTSILPSNTTSFAVVPTTPPRSNVPRYETQLPKKTATSDVQQHSVLSPYNSPAEVLTNPKVRIHMGARMSCKATSPAHMSPFVESQFPTHNCMEVSSPDDGDMSEAKRLPTGRSSTCTVSPFLQPFLHLKVNGIAIGQRVVGAGHTATRWIGAKVSVALAKLGFGHESDRQFSL